MVGQRLGRWRCEVGYSEAGAAVRRGRLPWVASAGSSLRPRPRGCSDAGNGRHFRLSGFPWSWASAHPQAAAGGRGSGSPLFAKSPLKLPPARRAFPCSVVSFSPPAVSPRLGPRGVAGRPSPAQFSKPFLQVSFLVIARDVVERGTNF